MRMSNRKVMRYRILITESRLLFQSIFLLSSIAAANVNSASLSEREVPCLPVASQLRNVSIDEKKNLIYE